MSCSLARKHNSTVIAIYETGSWLAENGVNGVIGVGKGGTQRVGELDVTMVNAVHSNSIHQDGK